MGVLSAEQYAKLKAAQEGFCVIGLQEVTGETGIRKDIDDLVMNEKEAFNVFIIALTNLQSPSAQNVQNPMSYFQIAGIHGLPLRLWNKEGVKLNADGFPSGYCHHSHIGFGPWHRPYLALLEVSCAILGDLECSEKCSRCVKAIPLHRDDKYRGKGLPR